MTQNDPNVTSNSNQMKQEPTDFNTSLNYEYPPYDHQKRSSWVGGSSTSSSSNIVQPPTAHQSHHMHNKRESLGCGSTSNSQQYQQQAQPPPQQIQQQPPIAHGKNDMASSSSTSLNSTPIYHHHNHHSHHHHRTQPQDSPIGTSAALLQPQQADIYAQAELYRRPTVFVSQASAYAYNARVVPPPAHNPSNRQVSIKN